MEIKTTKTISMNCPWCGYHLDAATGLNKPKPGDVSVCINCLNLLVFNDQIFGEKPTEEKFAELRSDHQLWSTIEQARKICLNIKKSKH